MFLSGAYVRDPKEVFEFISKLISQAKRKGKYVLFDCILTHSTYPYVNADLCMCLSLYMCILICCLILDGAGLFDVEAVSLYRIM